MSYPPQQPVPQYGQQGQPHDWQGRPQQQGYTPMSHPGYERAHPSYAPAPQPRGNPLAETPVSDWVRDGAAAVLLLSSLAMPWSYNIFGGADFLFSDGDILAGAATRVEVLLITLLSVLSITIGYLARFGVFGAAFTPYRAAVTRALLNVPYFLLLLLYIVFDATGFKGDSAWGITAGLGAAAAVGATGAILAAIPRRAEILSPQFSHTAGKNGYGYALGYFIFAVIVTLLGYVLSMVQMLGGPFPASGMQIATFFTLTTVVVAAPLLLILFVIRRSSTARLIALAYGVAMVAGIFISAFASQSLPETLWGDAGYPTLIVAMAAGIMSHPGLPYAMIRKQPLELWHTTMQKMSLLSVFVLGFILLEVAAIIIMLQARNTGLLIGLLVVLLISIVAALVLRAQLRSNFQHGRTTCVGIAAGFAAAGIVAVILAGIFNRPLFTGDLSGFDLSAFSFDDLGAILLSFMVILVIPTLAAVFFAPAGLILYGLLVQPDMRRYFAALAPQTQVPQYTEPSETGGYGQQQYAQVATPYSSQAAPSPTPVPHAHADPEMQRLAAEAEHPGTPAERLFELSHRPEFWVHLARNRSIYDGLADWLAQTGDANVIAELQARGREI